MLSFAKQNQDASRDKALDQFRNPNHVDHPNNRDKGGKANVEVSSTGICLSSVTYIKVAC